MIAHIKAWWKATYDSFHKSEVILWARIQVLASAIWAVAIVTDLSSWMGPKTLAIWLLFSGTVTEYARRRGSTVISTGELVATPVVEKVEVETGLDMEKKT